MKCLIFTFLFAYLYTFSSQASLVATDSNADYKEENPVVSIEEISTDEEMLIDSREELYSADDFSAIYSIQIPKFICMQQNVESKVYEANYILKVTNLNNRDERSCLVIEPQSNFFLKADGKKHIQVYVEQDETEFSNLLQDDLSLEHTTAGYVYTKEPLSSAEWTGSFSFNISLLDLGSSDTLLETEALEDLEEIELENDLEKENEIDIASPSNATKNDDLVQEDLKQEVIDIADENLKTNAIQNNLDSEPANEKSQDKQETNTNSESLDESDISGDSENLKEPIISESSESLEEPIISEDNDILEESDVSGDSENLEEPIISESNESLEESDISEDNENLEEPIITEDNESLEESDMLESSESLEEPIISESSENIEEFTISEVSESLEE